MVLTKIYFGFVLRSLLIFWKSRHESRSLFLVLFKCQATERSSAIKQLESHDQWFEPLTCAPRVTSFCSENRWAGQMGNSLRLSLNSRISSPSPSRQDLFPPSLAGKLGDLYFRVIKPLMIRCHAEDDKSPQSLQVTQQYLQSGLGSFLQVVSLFPSPPHLPLSFSQISCLFPQRNYTSGVVGK